MLTYKILKNHAGVMIVGDYFTLQSVHTVLHEVNEKSIILKNKEGPFLGLAYDIRKAYEEQRKVFKAPKDRPEIGPTFGVEVLWPVLLVQSRMLRESMAFMDTTKWQQCIAYNLEALIEEALQADFGSMSGDLIEKWMDINPRHPYPEEKLNSRGAAFCSWTKSERKKRFPGLLASLSPMYPAYYDIWVRNGGEDLVSPQEYDKMERVEWADPNW